MIHTIYIEFIEELFNPFSMMVVFFRVRCIIEIIIYCVRNSKGW